MNRLFLSDTLANNHDQNTTMLGEYGSIVCHSHRRSIDNHIVITLGGLINQRPHRIGTKNNARRFFLVLRRKNMQIRFPIRLNGLFCGNLPSQQ